MSQSPMFINQLGFLSNFDITPFFVPQLDVDVASGEHAFNALKTTDASERADVLAAPNQGQSKSRGRRVTLRPDWDAGVRVWAMQRVITAKFLRPDLRQRLDATGSLQLVETNLWHDQFWGSCYCPRHTQTPGQNMLGELLMAIRAHNRMS